MSSPPWPCPFQGLEYCQMSIEREDESIFVRFSILPVPRLVQIARKHITDIERPEHHHHHQHRHTLDPLYYFGAPSFHSTFEGGLPADTQPQHVTLPFGDVRIVSKILEKLHPRTIEPNGKACRGSCAESNRIN